MSRTGCLRGSPWAKEAAHYRHYRAPRALSGPQTQSDVRQHRRSAETRGGATRLSAPAMRSEPRSALAMRRAAGCTGHAGCSQLPAGHARALRLSQLRTTKTSGEPRPNARGRGSRRLRPLPTSPLGSPLAQRIRPDGCRQPQKRCRIYSS